jgi:SNF2 family DNA or RNA helicase
MMQPRIYQKTGARFLSSRSGLLGDRVGLGKTATALWALDEIRCRERMGEMLVLVIGPRLHKLFWIEEAKRVFPHYIAHEHNEGNTPVLTLEGPGRLIRLYLAHYEQFVGRDEPSHLTRPYLEVEWDVVVLDECHAIKNRDSQRAKWIKRLRTAHKIGLSASLVAEYAKDLWSILNWVAPEAFPYFWPWINRFCGTYRNDYTGRTEITNVKHNMLPILRKELAPHLLVRTLEDVGLELPPLTVTDVPLEITPEHRKVYNKFKRESLIEIKKDAIKKGFIDLQAIKDRDIITIIARFTRLHQVASSPGVFNFDVPEVKEEWLREYIANGGPPALVFTRYNHTREKIEGILHELNQRGWIVGTWDKLAVAHNFQHLYTVICWDMTLSYLKWEQGKGRCHRSGQEKPVHVYRLLAKSTVDYHIAKLIDKKHSANEILLAWLRGLYDDD